MSDAGGSMEEGMKVRVGKQSERIGEVSRLLGRTDSLSSKPIELGIFCMHSRHFRSYK